jgi:hypothetical protein
MTSISASQLCLGDVDPEIGSATHYPASPSLLRPTMHKMLAFEAVVVWRF